MILFLFLQTLQRESCPSFPYLARWKSLMGFGSPPQDVQTRFMRVALGSSFHN